MLYNKRFHILIVFLMLAVAATTFFLSKNNPKIIADSPQFEIKIETPKYSVKIDKTETGEKVTAIDFGSIGSSGDPDLPVKEQNLLLPPDVDDSSVVATLTGSKNYQIAGNHDIVPSPPAVVNLDGTVEKDWGTGKKIEQDKNVNIYNKNELYPSQSIEVVNIGNMRQYKIATVKFYPYQYNPVTKKLYRNTEGTISLTYKRSTKAAPSQVSAPDSVSQNETFKELIPGMVENSSDLSNWYPDRQEVSSIPKAKAAGTNNKGGYLILTTNSILQSSKKILDFKANKENLGFSPVTIVTENQWGGGTGDAAANNMRNFLRNNYSPYSYALLAGNPDPSKGDVPMKMTWPRRSSATYREAPTDYYFTDLDDNWDKDGDGFYGEGDNDLPAINGLPEIFVGRIPYYGNATDFDSILQKSMDYENGDLGADWVKKMLYAAKPSDTSTPGYQLGEAIKKDVTDPLDYPSVRVLDENYGLTPAPEYTPTNSTTFLKAVKDNHPGFVFWWTHGNETTAASIITTAGTASLNEDDDKHPFFDFQCSCLNGSPERSDNLGYALLKKGSIGTVSASRVSWYYPGQADYTNTDSNAGMTYQYAKALIKEHLPAAAALMNSRTRPIIDIWMNHLVFNLYGDPALTYKDQVGPYVETTPLIDTDNTANPYKISAKIFSNQSISGTPVIKWNTDGSQTYKTYDMISTGMNLYEGQIEPQPIGTKINYYIEASDSKGKTVMPGSAPRTGYVFNILADTVAPTISTTPLIDTAFLDGPYVVTADIKDDRAIGSAKLIYSINNGTNIEIEMKNAGKDTYEAEIPGPRLAGDIIKYHVEALDTSQNHNKTVFPAVGDITFYISPVYNVAIYNQSITPSYFTGSNTNAHQAISDILNTDSAQRFTTTVVTSLTADTLKDKDALIMPDNAPPSTDFPTILSWFKPEKSIITFESSTSFASASGLLWDSSGVGSGFGTYWDTNASQNDQIIKLEDPITQGYKTGDLIDSRGYTAEFIIGKLSADTKVLTGSKNDPTKAYAVYRDVVGKGRFIAFGPYIPLQLNEYQIIRNAVASAVKNVVPKPKDVTPPTTPANVKMTQKSSNSISLSWDKSSDDMGIAGYKIYRNDLEAGNITALSFVDKALTPSTSYKYQVAAYDFSGNFSTKSNYLTVVTDGTIVDTAPPSVPQNLQKTSNTSNSIDIKWDISTDNVGVTGYKIYRNNALLKSTATNNFSDTGLSPSTSYSYNISAFDAANNESGKSSALTISTTAIPPSDTTAPTTPVNVKLDTKSTTTANFSWTASTDNVGVTGYKIYRNNAEITSTPNTTYNDINLTAATSYSYSLAAYDVAGNLSVKSTPLVIITDNTSAPANTELSITVLSGSSYISNATVQLMINNQVSQTAVWNYRAGRYIFPQYVARNAIYAVKIQAPWFQSQTIQVNTTNAPRKPNYPNTYQSVTTVTLKPSGVLNNAWDKIKSIF